MRAKTVFGRYFTTDPFSLNHPPPLKKNAACLYMQNAETRDNRDCKVRVNLRPLRHMKEWSHISTYSI